MSIQHGPSARLAADEDEAGTTFRWSPSRSAQTLSLPEQIAETIGNAIIKGDLEPGQRIQEQTIASQFDVSRGPVREALRILERDGMVRILPRRGAQVTQLSIDEVSDVFAIRASLVGLVARLIAENPDPALIAKLRQRADKLNQLAASDVDADQYVQESYYMNMSMASGCGNPRLRDLIYSLAHQTVRYSRLGLSTKERRQQSAKLHHALVRALQKGDARRAQETAERLVMESRAMAIMLLREQHTGAQKKLRKR
ncbi:MAG: GntR family transcriptional regulator [Reyranellaceae bacterium]